MEAPSDRRVRDREKEKKISGIKNTMKNNNIMNNV